MAKIALLYAPATKHVLACATVAGDFDAKAKATDLVDKGLPLRGPGGAAVFLASANDGLKLIVADVAGTTLQTLLPAPTAFSVPDEKAPSDTPVTPGFAPNPGSSVSFTLPGPPGRVLKCVLAHQRGDAGPDNPATLIPDVVNSNDTSKSIPVDYQSNDHLALFVEGYRPVVR